MQLLSKSKLTTSTRPIKILQFGNGNFLRGFTDWMIEKANRAEVFNGDIHIVQVYSKSANNPMKDQDCLFHVIEKGLKNGKLVQETTLITCVAGITNVFEDYEEYLKLGENPDLRFVVSNTTEAGIVFEPTDSSADSISNTFPGKLTALLYHRFKTFNGDASKGLIFLPCELIEGNGEALKDCIQKYISYWKLPAGFSDWIDWHNTFCNTLVDRIVPGFPKDFIEEIQEKIGYKDDMAVIVEPYHFWAIEGADTVKEEFPMDKAGLNVKFVDNLAPFRTQKVRILNGGHTAMVPYGYLKGLRTVREAVEDSEIGAILKEAIYNEIIPTLDMPKEELEQFAADVLERFANPFIVHELKSIALNSISKFKVRVLPSLLAYYELKKEWPEKLILSFAAILVFYKGNYKGVETPVNDNPTLMTEFNSAWALGSTQETVAKLLSERTYWGEDLRAYDGLVDAVTEAVDGLLFT
ncbi:tagaturonate reductase [Algoriphagus ratkowskyi]|uniref:Tagaturonate reductase n=1 Tax=Algoriphagus ratkowskyi TaxID=57028 RepID=A0A2W7RQX2_9BACT|nr:tagaturonate reductase [Algoriphagus ratkowskyi]PZX61326.1 tagaturonate reductase [Algoriphagus ratkowskyi]TXD79431.1 tagaturonate reductase [Algoriphagus ratkowskyi]